MAYEQPYHQQQYATGQQQAAAGHENWTAQNAQQQPPPTAQYAEWDPSSQQPQVLPQWYQKPSDHATEGAGPANEWIGGQEGINLFPLSSAKTPFSDYGTEGGSTVRSSPFPSGPRTADELPPRKPLDRICGVKRNVFFILVAITTFVLVVGIATGLGVGLALGKNSNNDIAPAQTSTSSSPTPTTSDQTTSTSATATKVSPTPAFTGIVTTGSINCPRDNGTVYISDITSKPFNIECGHDYNSQDGSKDLSHQATTTMSDCIDLCGSKSACVGVGWGNYQGIPTCWLKSALGQPNKSSNWYFAVLQSLDQGNTNGTKTS